MGPERVSYISQNRRSFVLVFFAILMVLVYLGREVCYQVALSVLLEKSVLGEVWSSSSNAQKDMCLRAPQ